MNPPPKAMAGVEVVEEAEIDTIVGATVDAIVDTMLQLSTIAATTGNGFIRNGLSLEGPFKGPTGLRRD